MEVLDEALPLAQTTDDRAFVHTLYARAAHRIGDREQAVAHARQALSASGDLCRQVHFDSKNGVLSGAQEAIWSDWFQPLPRLDFLDPKYFQMSSTDQCPITIAKAEENYLILAEAALAANDLSEAKRQLTALLALVKSRPVQTDINDQLEGRYNGGLKAFPNDPSYRVQASPNDSLRSHLIIDRRPPCLISIPYISGTSVTQAMIDGLDNHGRLNTDLLAMGEGKCEQENKKKESPQKVLEMQPCGGSTGEVIALGFRHAGRAVSLFCQNPRRC